jgi:dTDP-4-amino-4,6-dideoxygalactose transaminase
VISVGKPLLGDEERAAVDRVLRSGHLAQGPEVERFEDEFSTALVAGRPCVAVSSGTSGLHLALLACGIGPGDEVVVPAFTFAATANAVALTGATPVFADIDLDTFCLDAASVKDVVSPRTAAVMPVHLYGHPADMDALVNLCGQQGLRLVEDAAQAHGAAWRGQPVGSFGQAAMFSLYPTKNMTAGEGGMVAADDPGVLRSMRLLRNQGMLTRYRNEVIGYNARMSDLHAAIGREQLRKLPTWNQRRVENAAFLSEHLTSVTVPRTAVGATHVFHQYTVLVDADAAERDRMVAALGSEHGVEAGVYYPVPLHELPSLAHYAPRTDLARTSTAAAQCFSLPVHPALSRADLETIVDAVNSVARAGS